MISFYKIQFNSIHFDKLSLHAAYDFLVRSMYLTKCFGYNFGSKSNTDDFVMKCWSSIVMMFLDVNAKIERNVIRCRGRAESSILVSIRIQNKYLPNIIGVDLFTMTLECEHY